jgi:hypothetical protein
MHRLTGAELTKLIDLKLVDRECGDLKLIARHQTTADTKPKSRACQDKMSQKGHNLSHVKT